MSLPIAVGGVSLSSEKIKGPYQPSLSKSAIDSPAYDHKSHPDVLESRPHQSVTWAVCPRNEWQARTVVSFFDKDVESSQENAKEQQDNSESTRKRMVEIRVQISPLARALSPNMYRETSYQLELFTYLDDMYESGDDGEDDDESDFGSHSDDSSEEYEEDSFSSESERDDDDRLEDQAPLEENHRQPQVIFSQDRRHLIVLLFHTKRTHSNSRRWAERIQHHQSAIVTFQLRKPKTTTGSSLDIRSRIPIPSYIGKPTPGSGGNSSIGSVANHQNESSATSTPDIGGSPAVATHPKFIPACNDITAICRLCREESNPVGMPGPAPPHSSLFLAITNNGNLNWVDVHSAQIVATALLTDIRSNGCYVSSMNASPASTVDSGLVALVIASSNPSSPDLSQSSQSSASNVTDHDDEDSEDDDSIQGSIETGASSSKDSDEESIRHRINGGDCVLIRWSDHSLNLSGTENGTRSENPPAMKNARLESVWSPPPGANENDELRVASVCFGSLSSVLCVVYTHSSERRISLGPRQKMAQILTLSDDLSNDETEGSDFVPTVSLYLSPDQVEQAPSVANFNDPSAEEIYENYAEHEAGFEGISISRKMGKENTFAMSIESRLIGIQHDPRSNSFMISSIFRGNRDMEDYWVGFVWNWRANAIGWMIQHAVPPLSTLFRKTTALRWSRLYFGIDGGPYLVYMNATLQPEDIDGSEHSTKYGGPSILNTSKKFVAASMLSPTNSSDTTIFTERSSLLLSENHVSFPCVVRKDSDVTVRELDWKLSALPLSYRASQGPPSIAAMGSTRAKSIAVASSRGVCVMDTHNQKWKQFGSPSEERAFSVLAMTWWEGSPRGERDDENDDLLVALTQTRAGGRFLSCWTSKR